MLNWYTKVRDVCTCIWVVLLSGSAVISLAYNNAWKVIATNEMLFGTWC